MIGIILAVILVLAIAGCIAGAVIFRTRKRQNKNLFISCVRIFHSLFNTIAVKILGVGAQAEFASAYVYGVRSEMQCRLEFAHIARRR